MIEQLEKILEQRTTVKEFDGLPIADEKVIMIKEAVSKTPSCNNRYNFKVKALGQSLEHRKSKVNLFDFVCTTSNTAVRYSDDNDSMVMRSPRSHSEANEWKSKKMLDSQKNGQVLAPLVLVWYFTDGDPINNDFIDVGLSCWNTIITAESLGIQSGLCGCFDKEYMKSFLGVDGTPAVAVGFGYAETRITNAEKHPSKPRPNWSDIIV